MRMGILRELLSDLGLRSVRTYLQSGNAVFEAPESAGRTAARAVERSILARMGYDVTAFVRTAAQLRAVVAGNPFAGTGDADPRFLHVTFLAGEPGRPPAASDLPAAAGERVAFSGNAVHLYLPMGYSSSRLSNAYFERVLACRATTRNWNTVRALEAMVHGPGPGAP